MLRVAQSPLCDFSSILYFKIFKEQLKMIICYFHSFYFLNIVFQEMKMQTDNPNMFSSMIFNFSEPFFPYHHVSQQCGKAPGLVFLSLILFY